MLTIVSTIIVLGLLVFVHELGHFIVAKLLDVKVERFSLGLPPKMIGRQIGETEYMVSWIPLGGYVKMLGENPDESNLVPEEDRPRSFSHKPPWARFLIALAGPGFNFVFAFVAFSLLTAFQGVPHLTPKIGKVQENMPAAAAGIQDGDLIVSIDGRPVKYFEDVLELVRSHPDPEVNVVVERDGAQISTTMVPKMVEQPNIFGEALPVPMIGIQATGDIVNEKVNPGSALYYGILKTWDMAELTVLSVVKIIQGKLSPKTLGGPIFIAQLTGEQARAGLPNLVFLAALLSVNLGILNLLPIPILDGGHIMFEALEMIFRRPISTRIREKAQQVGLVFLILFMVFVFYNDIARLVKGSGNGGQETTQESSENSRP